MTAAEKLVRHMLRCQADNADHIHLISPMTETYGLLLAAGAELLGKPADEVESDFEDAREKIESYRPLVSQVEHQREKAERYERALSTIAYDHTDDPTEIARSALG